MKNEEAMELRDKILQTAPTVYKLETEEDKWATALLLSKAYWQSEPEYITPDDRVLDLWKHGASPKYISYALDMSVAKIFESLGCTYPVVYDEYFPVSIPYLNKVVEGEVNSPKCVNTVRIKYYLPETYMRLLLDEKVVKRMLNDGYSIGDIGRYTDEAYDELIEMVVSGITEHMKWHLTALLKDWMRGRALSYLTLKHNVDMRTLRDILMNLGYCVADGNCDIFVPITEKNANSVKCKYKPKTFAPYLTLPNKLLKDDIPVLKKLYAQEMPSDSIASILGVPRGRYKEFLKENLSDELYAEVVLYE